MRLPISASACPGSRPSRPRRESKGRSSGQKYHLLHIRALASGASRLSMSASSSHMLVIGISERSWARAADRVMPLIPPAEEPAITSTITRRAMSLPKAWRNSW
ncbi:hypothetical protein D3C75_1133740 [compost metagenome]